MQSCPI